MSIRSNGSGDNLAVAASLGLTTGAFAFAGWVKLISDRASFSDFFGACDAVGSPTDYMFVGASDGTTALAFSTTGGPTGGQVLSVATWYYLVVSRGGTTLRFRAFDDTTSTTPLAETTATDGRNYTALDNAVIGQLASPEWPDAEFACVRYHLGVEWTNAQARTESQKLTPQTGGGTIYGNYKLETVTANSDGINDSGGAGHHLTNTGFVNGASRPSQLEALGGLTLTPTGSEATAQSGTPSVDLRFSALVGIRFRW